MGLYKETTDIITSWLQNHGTINEVTLGDVREVDLSTHSNFPLVHVIILNNDYDNGYSTYNYQYLFLDTFFEGGENTKLDILDEMNEVVTDFISALNHGSMLNSAITVSSVATGEVMYNQLQNKLYGWSLEFGLDVPNDVDPGTGTLPCG